MIRPASSPKGLPGLLRQELKQDGVLDLDEMVRRFGGDSVLQGVRALKKQREVVLVFDDQHPEDLPHFIVSASRWRNFRLRPPRKN